MLIDIRDLYKIYNEGKESEVRALDGVTLQIDKGEFVAIVGQSGSGKSTLMNVLGCLDIPTYGEYYLDGTDVTSLSDKELARIRNREIGFIFQGYNLIQELDALENVTLALRLRDKDRSRRGAIEARGRGLLGRVGSSSIICLHDRSMGKSADDTAPGRTIQALRLALPALQRAGFTFILPEEMAR